MIITVNKVPVGHFTHATKNNLSEQAQDQILELLNQVLTDLVSLQLQAKRAQWNVKRWNFIA